MQEIKDYYAIMGVPRGASFEFIKKTYRSKSRDLHPDNPETGDEQAFKELSVAYSTLSKPETRQAYDLDLEAYEHYLKEAARPPEPSWTETQIRTTAAYIVGNSSVNWDSFATVLMHAQTRGGEPGISFYAGIALFNNPTLRAGMGEVVRNDDMISVALAVAEIGVSRGRIAPSQEIPFGTERGVIQHPSLLAKQAISRSQKAERISGERGMQAAQLIEATLRPLINQHRNDKGLIELSKNPGLQVPPMAEIGAFPGLRRPSFDLLNSRGLVTYGDAAAVTRNLLNRINWISGLEEPHKADPLAGERVFRTTMGDIAMVASRPDLGLG